MDPPHMWIGFAPEPIPLEPCSVTEGAVMATPVPACVMPRLEPSVTLLHEAMLAHAPIEMLPLGPEAATRTGPMLVTLEPDVGKTIGSLFVICTPASNAFRLTTESGVQWLSTNTAGGPRPPWAARALTLVCSGLHGVPIVPVLDAFTLSWSATMRPLPQEVTLPWHDVKVTVPGEGPQRQTEWAARLLTMTSAATAEIESTCGRRGADCHPRQDVLWMAMEPVPYAGAVGDHVRGVGSNALDVVADQAEGTGRGERRGARHIPQRMPHGKVGCADGAAGEVEADVQE